MLKRQCARHREQIDSQIEAIDREWMSVLAANPALKARLDILLSIPGIGAATAIALLVDMPELGTMDAKQAASLAGLAAVTRQSGTWKGKSFIQGGRASIRQAIYMPALVAIRFNPQLPFGSTLNSRRNTKRRAVPENSRRSPSSPSCERSSSSPTR